MRLAVYTDYAYHRVDGEVFAERAFALFLARARGAFERFVVIGRLSPSIGEARYAIGEGVELVALPYYPSLAEPRRVLPALLRSLVRFWRSLDGIDCVWLFGPHPFAIVFAVIAGLRGRRVVLGVRQDMLPYMRSRRPGRRDLLLAARVLELAFKALARCFPIIVVGPEIARKYSGSRELLEIAVSLVDEQDLVSPEQAMTRDYDGELALLAVGRLETEKNPLLLADVLARLNAGDRRWRLRVCGEGSLRDALADRLAQLGQSDRAELLGYVPFGEPLADLYRSSHALVHTSWTEGLPQVLLEAFAAGLPVVASDVGGIRLAVGDAVRLVAPGDAAETATATYDLAAEPELRRRLITRGHEYVSARTADAEARRVALLIKGS